MLLKFSFSYNIHTSTYYYVNIELFHLLVAQEWESVGFYQCQNARMWLFPGCSRFWCRPNTKLSFNRIRRKKEKKSLLASTGGMIHYEMVNCGCKGVHIVSHNTQIRCGFVQTFKWQLIVFCRCRPHTSRFHVLWILRRLSVPHSLKQSWTNNRATVKVTEISFSSPVRYLMWTLTETSELYLQIQCTAMLPHADSVIIYV